MLFRIQFIYVLEGRDVLDGDGGLISSQTSLEQGPFSANLWLARGIDADYRELNIDLGAAWDVNGFELSSAIKRLEIRADEDSGDNELSLAITRRGVTVDSWWSTEIEGGYSTLAYAQPVFETDASSLEASVSVGVDWGYTSDDHDGLDSLETALWFEHDLPRTFGLFGYIAYSQPLEDLQRDDGRDVFRGGIGIRTSFEP